MNACLIENMQHTHTPVKKNDYYLSEGRVQAFVGCESHFFMHHFGRAEYDRHIPILSDSICKKAQPIVDALNAGTMSEDEAKRELDKIYY